MSILQEIEQTIIGELKKAVTSSGLAGEGEMPEIILEKPKIKAHGDYASNIAMQLAKIAKKPPRTIAETIVPHIDKAKANIQKIEIAGPGFINLFLDPKSFTRLPEIILKAGDAYGRSNIGNGHKIQSGQLFLWNFLHCPVAIPAW